jgi:uncharacterized protein YecE (DUF72 family)
VELNNTFYRRPSADAVARWLAQTPAHFRFCPKAQRGATWRAWTPAATETMTWLAESMGVFGDRLGAVLLAARGSLERDDEALARLPPRARRSALALEVPHASGRPTSARLLAFTTSLVASDWTADDPTCAAQPFIYLRLRRTIMRRTWTLGGRLAPFRPMADAYVFFHTTATASRRCGSPRRPPRSGTGADGAYDETPASTSQP